MTALTYPNIEAERARRGYSKDEFSQLLGVSRKTYYNWVSKGKIPQGKLEQMASIFGTTTELDRWFCRRGDKDICGK